MLRTRLTDQYGLDVPFVCAGMGFVGMPLLGGESAGLVREIRPAGEIVREMMDEARRIIVERLSPMADEAG